MNIAKVEFTTYLDTREIADKVWELLNDFVCLIHTDDKTYQATIRAGFITDKCSVPRIPFAYLLFAGIGDYAGVLHDGGYSKCKLVEVIDIDTGEPMEFNRTEWDEILHLGLIERNVPRWKANAMWAGVRALGWNYYKKS